MVLRTYQLKIANCSELPNPSNLPILLIYLYTKELFHSYESSSEISYKFQNIHTIFVASFVQIANISNDDKGIIRELVHIRESGERYLHC